MRMRKKKNLDSRLSAVSDYFIKDLSEFENFDGVYLEIGCGKGKFITENALLHPDILFVAAEKVSSVILLAAEKAAAQDIKNIRFYCGDIINLSQIENSHFCDRIYLNFSDPWPKDRHARRRLTHRDRLKTYFDVLKEEGVIEFKTDNDPLFEFSMEEIRESGYEILEYTEDLHSSDYESKYMTTEYEDRFSAGGKNINYVKFKRKTASK